MSECIISPNATDEKGYARTQASRYGKIIRRWHVLAWVQINHTPMPGGHPKNCINPEHLYEGSAKQNMLDKIADGTDHNLAKEQCPVCGAPYRVVIREGVGRGFGRVCTRRHLHDIPSNPH
jgi:hypothetical protein